MSDGAAGDLVAGRYRIVRTLGRGAYGAVYLAEGADGGQVALKVLHERLSEEGSESARRLDREAELVRRLDHPRIVKLLDHGHTAEGVPFIAFEVLEGQTLRRELAVGSMAPQRAVEIARQVLGALACAHAQGIVHRDIKPENVFLCRAPAGVDSVKVLDFGIAKLLAASGASTMLTATGQMLGTPQYMPPEQVRGQAVDARADVYAMGAVLAEMLTGQILVHGKSAIEVFMHHISDEPLALPEHVRRSALGPVIERAVSKSADARYPDAAVMLAALQDAAARLPVARTVAVASTTSAQTVDLQKRSSSRPPSASGTSVIPSSSLTSVLPTSVATTSVIPSTSVMTLETSVMPTPVVVPPAPRMPQLAPRGRGVMLAVIVAGLVTLIAGIAVGVWFVGGESDAARPSRKDKASSAKTRNPSAQERSERGGDVKPIDALDREELRRRLESEGWTVKEEVYETDGFKQYNFNLSGKAGGWGLVTLLRMTPAQVDAYASRPQAAGLARRIGERTVLVVNAGTGDSESLAERLSR
jgi:serine/threonine protein kinase